MFLFVICLCCVLQPLFHYYSVVGKRESLQRFVVEVGAKPAIFGSYSYDPVKQVFVPPPSDNDTDRIPDQIVNGSYVYSTAVGELPTPNPNITERIKKIINNHTDPVFRKHVTPVTHSNSAWWIRPKIYYKNFTSRLHKYKNI